MTGAPSIFMWTLDRDAGFVTFHRSDGKVATLDFDMSFFAPTSALSRYQWLPGAGLLVTTRSGDEFAFESPTPHDPEPLDGRLVVYLDQNQWRLVARAAAGDTRLSDAQREAVADLLQAVATRQIVLPASSAHYMETTKWTDHARRYDLGLTMLRHSRGWQMRHPISLRREELADLLAGREPARTGPAGKAAFTLAPDVLHGPESAPWQPSTDITGDDAFFLRVLTSTTTMIDLMLDGEPILGLGLRPDFIARVRECFETAVNDEFAALRQIESALTARLVEIEQQEDAYLALVGNPKWPQDKLEAKIAVLREERAAAEEGLGDAQAKLAIGRKAMALALDYLDNLPELYRQLSPVGRRLLNQVLFDRLLLDVELDGVATVASAPLKEPFGALHEVQERLGDTQEALRGLRTGLRRREPRRTSSGSVARRQQQGQSPDGDWPCVGLML